MRVEEVDAAPDPLPLGWRVVAPPSMVDVVVEGVYPGCCCCLAVVDVVVVLVAVVLVVADAVYSGCCCCLLLKQGLH